MLFIYSLLFFITSDTGNFYTGKYTKKLSISANDDFLVQDCLFHKITSGSSPLYISTANYLFTMISTVFNECHGTSSQTVSCSGQKQLNFSKVAILLCKTTSSSNSILVASYPDNPCNMEYLTIADCSAYNNGFDIQKGNPDLKAHEFDHLNFTRCKLNEYSLLYVTNQLFNLAYSDFVGNELGRSNVYGDFSDDNTQHININHCNFIDNTCTSSKYGVVHAQDVTINIDQCSFQGTTKNYFTTRDDSENGRFTISNSYLDNKAQLNHDYITKGDGNQEGTETFDNYPEEIGDDSSTTEDNGENDNQNPSLTENDDNKNDNDDKDNDDKDDNDKDNDDKDDHDKDNDKENENNNQNDTNGQISPPPKGNNTVPILIGVIVALIVIIAAIVGFIIFRRFRQNSTTTEPCEVEETTVETEEPTTQTTQTTETTKYVDSSDTLSDSDPFSSFIDGENGYTLP